MFKWLKRQDGATAVEYALLITLVGGVVAVAVAIFGGHVKAMFESVINLWTLP
jgi:Flp pilus assembly pilin Flp